MHGLSLEKTFDPNVSSVYSEPNIGLIRVSKFCTFTAGPSDVNRTSTLR